MEELEFLIKWKGFSHLHNSWETSDFCKEFKGYRKIENFIRQVVIEDREIRNDPEISPEEIEQKEINMEMERRAFEDYKTIERIISIRDNDNTGKREYLCKWKRLNYRDCTWEIEIDIPDAQGEIDQCFDRNQCSTLPDQSASITQRKPHKYFEQPEYLKVGGELRDYQVIGLNWMARKWHKDENGILGDEMGLGKTIQTIAFLSYLFHDINLFGPFLIVVPLSTIGAWQKELNQWAPDMNAIAYIGDGDSREIIREYEFYLPNPHTGRNTKKLKFNILLTTFEMILKDKEVLGNINWKFLCVDEAHRLKNHESQLHESLRDFKTRNRLLITGTPLQNSVKELLALAHFLNPKEFDDFLEYDLVVGEENQEEKIMELQERLKPYMIRRLKKDVEKSLPVKTERILRIELSALQVEYYKNILTKNFAALSKKGGQHSLLNVAMELKKASNHPFLFPAEQEKNDMKDDKEERLRGLIMGSGKVVLLDKLLVRLKEGGHKVLIFSQMVKN
jgi:chromodomain-helicase-DNA-binding protein 1